MDKLEQSQSKHSYLENQYGEFWIEDGIIVEVFKPTIKNISLEIAVMMVSDRLKISNGVTMPLFVDLNNASSIDLNAREFFSAGDSLKYVSASAFLLHNYIHWLGGKLFLSINRPKTRIEFFRIRGKAMKWLKNYRTEMLN